ncbi:NFACT family protein [Thermotoga sp. KOL6]|uniref:Rqc2 family fibronectin-binding protein n=1 Tax=Thermotoga sp. KOL6 TaxID=126741 RepID=UPI000C78F641|nr:NFACT family protein [Thermotoga sp. KOL6]PLV59100.1 fibronectin-binding protein [Thermotoga sp. KOL6]
MPVDGLLIYKVVRELRNLKNEYLRQIYQPTTVDYYFLFRSRVIRVCLKPDISHVSIAEKESSSEKMPTSFTMLLRKELKGARLLGIKQLGMDRTIVFEFEKLDEVEGNVQKNLFVEIMGAHSNIILVKEGKIVDAHKRIVTKKREILPGKEFTPFPSGKFSLFELKELPDKSPKTAKNVLLSLLEGFSPLSVEEVLYRCGYSSDTPWNEVDRIRILEALNRIKEEIVDNGVFVYYEKSHPVEISAFKYTMLNLDEKYFESPSEGLNEFVRWKEEKSTLENMKNRLSKIVTKKIEELEELEEKLLKELSSTTKAKEHKRIGDLIIQNLWKIKGKTGKVELVDWETGEKVVVDVGNDPSRTAQKYYDTYKKLLRKKEKVSKRIQDIQKEKDYLYQLWQTIDDAEDLESLEGIEEEMREARLLRKKESKNKHKRRETSRFRETKYMGFRILIGKNNKQNDELVRSSSKEDIWLHAHEMPGAHVVVKAGGKTVPQEVIEYAASFAAGYSKGKDSGKVPVDYTLIKYVKKPKGFKPGMVIYTNYKTILVEPRRLEE